MRIALAQLAATDDVATNLGFVRDVVARAADAGAELVLLPEYAMYERALVDASFADIAEPVDGPFCSAAAALAREHRIAVVAGMVERHPEGGRPFNTLAVFDASGGLVARSRKIQLYDAQGFQESAWISPAPDPRPIVVDLAGLKVGFLTCYDLRFPELSRSLADDGADLIAVCASWVPGTHKVAQWDVLTRARAIENGVFVAAVSQAEPISTGHSRVVDPDGVVQTSAAGGPDLLVTEIARV